MSKKILIIGSGGREHALAWKLAESPQKPQIFVAPGNAGTVSCAENISIQANDFQALISFAKTKKINLIVVGPDDPLAEGIVDKFKREGFKIFGPVKTAANLEASKAFAKSLMQKFKIPTARFQIFANYDGALAYVQKEGLPIVIKASGLALGKGVFICHSIEEAKAALQKIFIDKIFGAAGKEVVIEEFLEGQEISIHAFCDGKVAKLFPAAQDHKAIHDGDQGPNTGGMGVITPLPWVSDYQLKNISSSIVDKTLSAMRQQGRAFEGLLYPGLKMTKDGPKVLEFNVRFGDPETQAYMRLLKTDLLDIIEACVDHKLDQQNIEWHNGSIACVILASKDYPGAYEKGFEITGIDTAETNPNVKVFHAGTALHEAKLITNGGRVLAVTAHAESLHEAIKQAYHAASLIQFQGKYYRQDIGAKALTKV
jgi:phosphoribosylamine--glycine ligase